MNPFHSIICIHEIFYSKPRNESKRGPWNRNAVPAYIEKPINLELTIISRILVHPCWCGNGKDILMCGCIACSRLHRTNPFREKSRQVLEIFQLQDNRTWQLTMEICLGFVIQATKICKKFNLFHIKYILFPFLFKVQVHLFCVLFICYLDSWGAIVGKGQRKWVFIRNFLWTWKEVYGFHLRDCNYTVGLMRFKDIWKGTKGFWSYFFMLDIVIG